MTQLRFFVIFLIVTFPSYLYALSVSKSASVSIVIPLSAFEDQQLNFGKVLPPATGFRNVRVRRDGTYASTTGTIGSFQKEGRIKVVGSPGAQFNVTGTTASTIPGVAFTTLLYPSATQTLPALGVNAGQRVITIGGVIRVSSSAVAGNYNSGELSYTLAINYQ